MIIFAYSWISYLLSAFKKNNTESHWESLLKPPWGVFFLRFHADNQKNRIDIWENKRLFFVSNMDRAWNGLLSKWRERFLWLWIEKDTEFVALNVYFWNEVSELFASLNLQCLLLICALVKILPNELLLLSVRYDICLTAVWSAPYIKGCITLTLLAQCCGSPPC